jgi:hypothetical protein
MNHVLKSLISDYSRSNEEESIQALREILQHIALLGLWRSKFFEKAAFYGGTALRIFYGLPRFSEDMDFSLLNPNTGFSLVPYIKAIHRELDSLGLKVTIETKKRGQVSQIESAFIKADTIQNLIYLEVPQEITGVLHRNARVKVKLEIDILPPPYARYKVESLLLPVPFLVKLFSPSCLFSGKMHALLCRQWKSRIKGRDYFDFLWFIGKNIPCDLKHLKARMVQTGHLKQNITLDRKLLIKLLHEKIESVDLQKAKHDVEPFVNDIHALDLWTPDLFHRTINKISV